MDISSYKEASYCGYNHEIQKAFLMAIAMTFEYFFMITGLDRYAHSIGYLYVRAHGVGWPSNMATVCPCLPLFTDQQNMPLHSLGHSAHFAGFTACNQDIWQQYINVCIYKTELHPDWTGSGWIQNQNADKF